MISVKDALALIETRVEALDPVEISTSKALGQVLSKETISPINMPPFNQSAMDGYALGSLDKSSTVKYEIQAGDNAENTILSPGESARIFTGAMVPAGTVAIAKQEIVERNENTIHLSESVTLGMNIRPKGEQIQEGETAMQSKTLINPAGVGFLLGLGIEQISVYRKPRVVIIVTGNELTQPGSPLLPGKIYESNSQTIKGALSNIGIESEIQYVHDDFESTKLQIKNAITQFDLVLTTGGISVGDYDYVGKAFNELGVEQVFYKVKQKPGKPLFFGLKNRKVIFGLPGNPAAALTCFYMYVFPAIQKLMGHSILHLEKRTLRLAASFKKSPNLSAFLKADFKDDQVEILNAQSSAMLSAFSVANCLVYLEEGRETWQKDELVLTYLLPQ